MIGESFPCEPELANTSQPFGRALALPPAAGGSTKGVLALLAEAERQSFWGGAIRRFGFADAKIPPPKQGPVQGSNGLSRGFRIGESDKGVSPPCAGDAIRRVVQIEDISQWGQEVKELCFGTVEWDVSNIEIHKFNGLRELPE